MRSGKTQPCSTTSEDAHEAAPARTLKWYLVIAFWRWVCGTTTVTQYAFTVLAGQTVVATEHQICEPLLTAFSELARYCSADQRCDPDVDPRQPLRPHRVDDTSIPDFVLQTLNGSSNDDGNKEQLNMATDEQQPVSVSRSYRMVASRCDFVTRYLCRNASSTTSTRASARSSCCIAVSPFRQCSVWKDSMPR